MNAYEQYLVHLREALTYLYDPHFLHHSPLLAQLNLAQDADSPGGLRDILIAAIEELKPAGAVPTQTREWRIYELLFYRYVQQFSQQEVADQLGISVRHLRREQVIALEALGERLKERFRIGDSPAHARQTPADDQRAPLDQELAWLRDSLPDKVTDLSQELPAVLRLLRPLARQHNVDLRLNVSDDLVEAAVHPVAVRQILLSVLNSAIHCPPVRRISISAHLQQTELAIRVHYAARGCPEVGTEKNGLGTAQRIARLCGCALRVAVSQETIETTIFLPALGQLPVLVIDDNPDTLELFQRYVMGTRYRLVGLREPAHALRVAEEVVPRLIIVDIMMPQIDGWEIMGQLLHHPRTGHIPVLVCSIVAQEELALSLGASGFIPKPVSRQSFLSTLECHSRLDDPRLS